MLFAFSAKNGQQTRTTRFLNKNNAKRPQGGPQMTLIFDVVLFVFLIFWPNGKTWPKNFFLRRRFLMIFWMAKKVAPGTKKIIDFSSRARRVPLIFGGWGPP